MQEEQAHPLGIPRVEVSNAQPTMSPYMVGLAGDRFPCYWSADYPIFIGAAATGVAENQANEAFRD